MTFSSQTSHSNLDTSCRWQIAGMVTPPPKGVNASMWRSSDCANRLRMASLFILFLIRDWGILRCSLRSLYDAFRISPKLAFSALLQYSSDVISNPKGEYSIETLSGSKPERSRAASRNWRLEKILPSIWHQSLGVACTTILQRWQMWVLGTSHHHLVGSNLASLLPETSMRIETAW